MRWDRVDAVAARCAIQRMAIHKHKTLEEIATAITLTIAYVIARGLAEFGSRSTTRDND